MAGAVLRSGRLCENFHPHRQNRAHTSTHPACHATKPQITDLPNDFDEPLGLRITVPRRDAPAASRVSLCGTGRAREGVSA